MGKKNSKQATLSDDDLKRYREVVEKGLRETTEPEEVLKLLAVFAWFNRGNKTLCPQSTIPSVENLCDFLRENEALHEVESEGKKLLHFFLIESQSPSPLGKKKPIRSDSDGRQDIELQVRFRWDPGHAYVIMFLGSLKHPDTYGDAFILAHHAWIEARKTGYKENHPLASLITAWQDRPRTAETASTSQAKGMVRVPYRASEVLRREWRPFDGDVKATIVDGEPLAARMTDVTPPSKGKKLRVFVSKGQGQLGLTISTKRQIEPKPVPLIAFESFSDDLRSPLATDVAILMTIAHASNQDIRLTSAEGARFLARGRDGKVRSRVRDTDVQRFENAFGALHGMSEWVLCPDGIYRLYPLIMTDRINDDEVEFGPPTWAKNERGLYTLSGAFGHASASRLIGQANDGGLWRTIVGVEYWLARGQARYSKKQERMVGPAKTLRPATGKTGPGEWQKITWRQLLILSGDYWDHTDKKEEAKARKRYERRIERLQGYGTVKTESGKRVKKKIYPSYFTPSLGSAPAEAGDTVEFFKSDRGHINVRATARFVEAAKLADEEQFEIMRLADFMGI